MTSFFTFGNDCANRNSDEIDFEFISKKTNDDATYPNGDPLLTNTWNESFQQPLSVLPKGLDLTKWNVFRIYWYPDLPQVQWTWVVDPDTKKEEHLRTETAPFYLPNEPMAVYFNVWAPCYTSWSEACDPWDEAADQDFKPVNDPDQNEVHTYEIDYVEVRAKAEILNESTKLSPSDVSAGGEFGWSTSISGEVAILGARRDDYNGAASGSAFVFHRNGSSWEDVQRLLPSDGAALHEFGVSVSVFGEVAVIGAHLDDDNGVRSGSAYVFNRNGASWEQSKKLLAADGAPEALFGRSVSVSGDVAAVGARGANAGYVFRWNGFSWIEEQRLFPWDGANDNAFGISIGASKDLIIVGAYLDDDACPENPGCNSGSAYVFRWNGSAWQNEQKLLASDGDADDNFGVAVSVSDSVAVIGAWTDEEAGPASGSAYVFRFNSDHSGSWIEEGKLLPLDGGGGRFFGISASVSGQRIVVGSPTDIIAPGSVYVFGWNGSSWFQEHKVIASDGADFDKLGWSVAASGTMAIAGAPFDDCADRRQDCGSAYVFSLCGDLDADGICDSDDECNCTPSDAAIDESGRPLADLDLDCDGDLLDFRDFQIGFTGDLSAYKAFQVGFTGPINP